MKMLTVWSVSLLLVFAEGAGASIIYVPDDYTTIQAGVNAAANGDTVLVEQGTYSENVNLGSHQITLASRFILDGDNSHIQQTIIDGRAMGSVLTISGRQDTNTVIAGFVIQNGNDSQHGGGGIYCNCSSPVIRNNIIMHNTSTEDGGGVSCLVRANAVIRDNVVAYNISSQFNGGGIACSQSNVIIRNNLIIGNLAKL